jgi:peptidase E
MELISSEFFIWQYKILYIPYWDYNKQNSHFISTVKEFIKQKNNDSIYDLEIKHCPNSIFIYPVTEEEVINLIKGLKGKPNLGNVEIP